MRILKGIAALLVVLGIGLFASRIVSAPGAVLYVGGPVLTMDADNRVAEALATDGERIVAVGEATPLRAWAKEKGARVVELKGRTLLPGFNDAHGHFPGTGVTAVFVDLNSPPIGDVSSIDDLVRLLAARAAETSEGEWIVGMGYDDTLLAEKRHPTRADLDKASTVHPIGVSHISGHLAVANTAALEKIGFDAGTPDPSGGVIQRDAAGEPNGVLEETAMETLAVHLTPSAMQGLTILRTAGQQLLEQGVTTAQSGATVVPLLQMFDWAAWLGMVPVRMVLWPEVTAAQAILDGDFVPSSWDLSRVRTGAVKLIADGSIQGYTGYLREPYHVPRDADTEYRGYPRIPRDELIELVVRFHAAGMQIAVHGNGDASIDDILDAFEQAQRENPRSDTRHIVIHAQMARDDQLDRMKTLGVIPSFFSLHTFYWGDRHRDIFMGPERAARMSPAQSALRRGVHFTIHSDSPVVPMEPLRLVWSAVNRKTRSGRVIGPNERISVMDALRAVTIDTAWQHFEDHEKGSLEPGKLADLVILDRNPLEDPDHIDEIRVQETILGGRSLYRASN